MSADSGKLGELRRAFDSGFAAERAAPVERVDLIALRAGERSYAVRISEIGSVVPFRGVVPLPCQEPALLGLAAVRGTAMPVYDLAALVGDGAAAAPRWMLLSAGTDRVALAFDEIEEYLRLPREKLVAASERGAAATPARAEVVRDGSSLRPVVSMASVLRNLEQRFGLPTKER
jgi:chemotaxis signal transduction protein